MHDAWQVLFFNPFFWEQTKKHGLKLRRVCRDFRLGVPEQCAIAASFTGVSIRKADIFRLFPLSVSDVVGMRSPLLFVDAFKLALQKTDGFEFCIAVMREKGLMLWDSVGVQRENLRSQFVSELASGGVVWSLSSSLFESAVSGRRYVDSAVVWRLDCSAVAVPAWVPFRPTPSSHPRTMYQLWEYDIILFRLKDAVGFWYKGIRKDVQIIIDGIKKARSRTASGDPICCMHHQHIAGKKFLFGIIKFHFGMF